MSMGNVYFWGFTAILIYHVSSVFLFHNLDHDIDAVACGIMSTGSDNHHRSRFLQQEHQQNDNDSQENGRSITGLFSLPSTTKDATSNTTITTTTTTKKRFDMNEFIPTDPDYVARERQVTCTRWNYTYIFPKAPSFIIIGTQKGGTSALAALLDHHPWIQSSYYFEPHFFDFNEVMLDYRFRLDEPEAVCKLLRTYLRKNWDVKKLRKYPNLLAFEKTPSYILTPNAPKRIKATVPWAKIIVTLRNPVDRLISQHKMTVMRHWENRTFEETLAEDINIMRYEGYWVPRDDPLNTSLLGPPAPRPLRKYKTNGMLYRGLYSRQLLPWLEEYRLGEELMVIQYEELKANPTKVLNQVLDFVNAPAYDFPHDVVNKSYSPGSSRWLEHYDPAVQDHVEDYLRNFYKPYNEELADLLGDHWRNVWD